MLGTITGAKGCSHPQALGSLGLTSWERAEDKQAQNHTVPLVPADAGGYLPFPMSVVHLDCLGYCSRAGGLCLHTCCPQLGQRPALAPRLWLSLNSCQNLLLSARRQWGQGGQADGPRLRHVLVLVSRLGQTLCRHLRSPSLAAL